jgi:hypothetical protein
VLKYKALQRNQGGGGDMDGNKTQKITALYERVSSDELHDVSNSITRLLEHYALKNNFDSNDLAEIRDMFNDMNAREKSKKIRSVLKTKGAEGKKLTNTPIYGYRLDPEDKNKWVVDPEAAEVVKLVYQMYVEGQGPYRIAKALHDKKILTPTAYMSKARIGKFRNYTVSDPYKWNAQTVTNILEMPEYAGHTVNFKTYKPSHKNIKKKTAPREDWLIFRNTHEAVIDEATWEEAQKRRKSKRCKGQHELVPGTSIFQDSTRCLTKKNITEKKLFQGFFYFVTQA